MLEKASSVQRWHVAPTMTRGSKATASATDALPASAKPTKTAAKTTQPKESTAVKPHIKKNALKTKSKPVVPVSEYHDGMIRKHKAGRVVIRELMLDLLDLDEKVFVGTPCFDSNGRCRMPGASSVSWDDLLDYSPFAFEMLHLGQQSTAVLNAEPIVG